MTLDRSTVVFFCFGLMTATVAAGCGGEFDPQDAAEVETTAESASAFTVDGSCTWTGDSTWDKRVIMMCGYKSSSTTLHLDVTKLGGGKFTSSGTLTVYGGTFEQIMNNQPKKYDSKSVIANQTYGVPFDLAIGANPGELWFYVDYSAPGVGWAHDEFVSVY
jgi:hypothetical protein